MKHFYSPALSIYFPSSITPIRELLKGRVNDIAKSVTDMSIERLQQEMLHIAVLRTTKVLPRLELGLLDSKSRVITITP